MMTETLAYVPVCTSCFTAHPHSNNIGKPAPHLTNQDIIGAGIIALIALVGFAYLLLTDR